MRRALPLLAAALALALAGCTTAAPPAAPGNREAVRELPGGTTCGVERWPVKTGTDADAALVNLSTVVPATIASLVAGPPPPLPLPQASRVRPAEVTVYQVTATLREYRIEADGDVHAVLAQTDAQGHAHTMVAEFPDPACAPGSAFLPQIAAARNAFDALFHPSGAWQQSGAVVTVTGIGFYDPEHGQTGGGVLPGGQVTIELHPALAVTGAPGPSPAPS